MNFKPDFTKTYTFTKMELFKRDLKALFILLTIAVYFYVGFSLAQMKVEFSSQRELIKVIKVK